MNMSRLRRPMMVVVFFLSTVTFFGGAAAVQHDPNFCGNKHKNLVRLQAIVQDIPDAVIPEFVGVPTRRVEAFLRQYTPDIFDKYATVVTLLSENKATQAEMVLNDIQESIKACFVHNSFNFTQDELLLVQRIARERQFFMVRSTGVEDGAIANAGGNASIAYVNPDVSALKSAMGEVIASYFGMQSIKNRIAGGETLSADDLCLPVLIQVLIGEAFDGSNNVREIPVSGVAYTTNQSLSSQNFRVTEIDAAYGHGEGVVANRVIADRYYVTSSRVHAGDISIYPTLYYKEERLVPHFDSQNNNHTLIAIKNGEERAHKSVLSHAQVKKLYTVLKAIEAHYGQPMDVEFVVLDATVYIVQARPAMHVAMVPSYCAFERFEDGDTSARIEGTTLVPGKAKVLCITNPQDLIIVKTLDEADQMANSGTCKAVFVDTWASSLSHAAVNFKSYGTPCMVVPSLARLKELVAQISVEHPLVIDIQRRCIFVWKNSAKNIRDFVAQGWLEHPVDCTLSVWTDRMQVLAVRTNALSPELCRAFAELKSMTKTSQQQKELLLYIATCITEKVALTDVRINHLNGLCVAAHIDNVCAPVFTEPFECFKALYKDLVHELMLCVEQQAEHFEFLFYHKMLEALLSQKTDTHVVLGGYTYAYFLNYLIARDDEFKLRIEMGPTSTVIPDGVFDF